MPASLSLVFLVITLLMLKELRFEALILNDLIAFSCAIFFLMLQIKSLHKHLGMFSWSVVRRSFQYGFPSYLAAITNFINNRLLWLLISFRSGQKELGIYILAQSLLEQGGLLLHPMSTVLFSRVTRMNQEDVKRNTSLVVASLASLASLGILTIFVLVDKLIPAIYGEQFAASTKFIKYLSPILVLDSVSRATNSVLQGLGMTKYFLAATIGSTMSGVLIAFSLYPALGITGIAISSVVSSTVMLVISTTLLFFSLKNDASSPLRE
jgi:O-antigen/teichoic acid export membrane protein